MIAVLFTHPLLQLLARTRFFNSGGAWSGFDAKNLGSAGYVGRGQFRAADKVSHTKLARASKEANKRQTIAERKAAELLSPSKKSGEKN
jgi:preprotein translocase subunit SecD